MKNLKTIKNGGDMKNVKYPEQVEKLKEMRRALAMTATQAAEIVRTDVRNWQKWETGEIKVPESAIELFCIKKQLKYSLYATEKSEAQIARDLKREEKFTAYKARQQGSSLAHGLTDEEVFDQKIPEIETERERLKDNLKSSMQNGSDLYAFEAKKVLEFFKQKEDLSYFVFDQKELENGKTILSDKNILDSNDYIALPYNDKILVKIARSILGDSVFVSFHDIIHKFDKNEFSLFLSVLSSFRDGDVSYVR